MCRIYLCLILVTGAACKLSSKALEGYAVGFMPDCPGFNITRPISPARLKNLTITVYGKKKAYNYYQMDRLAKDRLIDFKKKTVMYVSGFDDHPEKSAVQNPGDIYKQLGYNVLLLNMKRFTTVPFPIAAANMRTIGKHVAEMLVTLSKHGLDPKKLELLGFSLGGHTISFIAKNYKLATGVKISRLTGLDPSGPCFRNLGPEDRLDDTDADFVDVVHTNIDGLGMAAPVGHVNFYVNGGEYQPGSLIWPACTVMCCHVRAYMIWVAALNNPNEFIAMKCDSVQEARNRDCYGKDPVVTNVIGLKTDKKVHGIFYLTTQNNYPFFMGKKGMKKENDYFSVKQGLSEKSLFLWAL